MCNRQVVLLSVKEQDTNDQKHIREEAQTDMDRFDHQFDRKTKKSERFKGGLRRGEEAGGGREDERSVPSDLHLLSIPPPALSPGVSRAGASF